jgi:hypothetical protein
MLSLRSPLTGGYLSVNLLRIVERIDGFAANLYVAQIAYEGFISG